MYLFYGEIIFGRTFKPIRIH